MQIWNLASAYIDVTETFSAFSQSEFILRSLNLLLRWRAFYPYITVAHNEETRHPFLFSLAWSPRFERIVSCKISQAGCSYLSVTLM